MAYRAQRQGIFGSGLFPRQPSQNTAGDVIDAVTRGATTLIQGAYARAQQRREQALQDQETARRDRAEQRQIANDEFEHDLKTREEARATETQSRADATAGYTPGHEETKDVVEPGTVQSNGLFGAPGKVTAPRVTQQKLTIPAALDYTKSTAYRARQQEHDIKEQDRGEHIADAEKIHRDNRSFDARTPVSRSAAGGAGGSSDVHASAAVRAQLSEVNQSIKSLETQRTKLLPSTYEKDGKSQSVGGSPTEVAKIDSTLAPLYQRRDSLRTVNDRVSEKITDKAGVSRTIQGALTSKAQKSDNTGSGKPKITKAEAAELRKRNFSQKQIDEKYQTVE